MAVMLLEWVCTSMFLILVVLALRAALGKRVSAGLRYALWAVVLMRLLVPVQLFTFPLAGTRVFTGSDTVQTVQTVPDAPAPLHSVGAEQDAVPAPVGQTGPSAVLTAPKLPSPPAVPDAPEPPDFDHLPGWMGYLGWAWLLGSAAVALVLLASNLRFYWILRRERIPLERVDCPLRAYVAVGLPSPCLFGIVRPAVYVTPEAAADPAMLRHVLAHEYTHYRHGDHIWSLLRCAALAVHWWDPLVWLAARLSRRDGELACDEGALKRLGDGERAAYGSTLLALVTARPRPGDLFRCATTMAGDKKSLKERIGRIAKAPKRVIWAAAVAVLVTALACACAFGSAEERDPDPAPSADPAASTEPSAQPSQGIDVENTVPADVLDDAEEFVRGRFEALRDEGILFGLDGASAVPDPPEVDDWRIERLTGPYWSGERYWRVLGINRRVELWNVVYAFHSTTPDKAMNLANGATELTGDGWLTPMNYGANYLVYELGEDGSRTLLTDFGDTGEVMSVEFRRNLRTKLAAGGIPEDMADAYRMKEHAEFPFEPGEQPDFNHNGVPELVQTVDINDGEGTRLEVWEDGRLLWSDVAANAHAGWNAVFLCTLDGEDCLLRYNPYMGQGWADYTYQLFTLSESGEEQVVRENSVRFDINFSPFMHGGFDPEAIAAFMDEVNGLLANSVQLINTDLNLLDAFQREGRLYDSLWWLNNWGELFTRDEGKSLLENLRDFQKAMETVEAPVFTRLNDKEGEKFTGRSTVQLSYQGNSTQFEADWDYNFQPAEFVVPQVIDWNGDGRAEIVVNLNAGHGTGALSENLYAFDAETLEQYDTSGLNELILGSIRSTGDENNYYLDLPGGERAVISKREVQKEAPETPLANAIGFADYITYSVKDGKVFCWLGCDTSGRGTNYIGTINVRVDLTPEGGFTCGGGQYTAG